MTVKNYYHILGVNQDVGADEIKNAYRKLAHQYHPDVSHDPNGEDKFKEIGEAYETLKIPERRLAYDRQAFRYIGRRADDLPMSDFYACWNEMLWINCWCWWVDPDLWQSETQHASTTV